jgi:hypothetical protein
VWVGISDLPAAISAVVRVSFGDRQIAVTEVITDQTHPKFARAMKVPLNPCATLTFKVSAEVQEKTKVTDF